MPSFLKKNNMSIFFKINNLNFVKDDLEDDDVMIVDTGEYVFLWLGSKSSEVEVKLAYKSAQVYCGKIV